MFNWLDEDFVLQLHRALVDEHGGSHGVLNHGSLESTLQRPVNLLQYKPSSHVFELAASLGYGLAKNHCFNDGNKRIALVGTDVFLQLNAYELQVDEMEATDAILALAGGDLNESEFALWVEANAVLYNIDED